MKHELRINQPFGFKTGLWDPRLFAVTIPVLNYYRCSNGPLILKCHLALVYSHWGDKL